MEVRVEACLDCRLSPPFLAYGSASQSRWWPLPLPPGSDLCLTLDGKKKANKDALRQCKHTGWGSFLIHAFDNMTARVYRTRLQKVENTDACVEKTKSDPKCRIGGGRRWMDVMYIRSLLGLLFGEMVTNLLIIPGDCCIGGVRHILSSFSVLGVISSPTRIRSRLPSSTPFPNHRPHGNLHGSTFVFISFCPDGHSQHNGTEVICLAKACSLVRVPRDLVSDKHTLHQPFRVQPRVIVTHLHCR